MSCFLNVIRKTVLNTQVGFYSSLSTVRKRKLHIFSLLCQEERNINRSDNIPEKWEIKMKFWIRKYEDLFGITKLSEEHEKVLEAQEKLQNTQEKRREVQEEIFVVQKKLQEMQDILHKTSMGDDMYISVVTQVHELLKKQKQLQEIFSICDKTEREQQTNLAQAINNSQDHEKMYREKTKYLSLIAGTVGAFLGLIASTVNVWRYRKEVKDIKSCAGNISCDVNELKKTVDKLSFPFLFNGELVNPFLIQNDRKQGEDLLSKVKFHQELLDNCIKNLSILVNEKLSVGLEKNGEIFNEIHIKHMLNNLEENMNSRLNFHSSVSLIFLTSLLAFSVYAFINR